MQTKLLLLALWSLALVAIYSASLSPNIMPTEKYHLDKLLHFLAYFSVSFAPAFIIPRKFWALAILAIFLILFGSEIEVAQNYVPDRTFSFADIAANSLGVLTGIASAIHIRKKRA